MAIFEGTDTATLQEIRFEIDPALTVEELPDSVLDRRTVLRAANRETLKALGLTETEYNALPQDDERREIAEEVVIKRCAYEVIPTVAQIVMDNENGLLTRYQRIDWNMRQRQITAAINKKLQPYRKDGLGLDAYYSATSRTKEEPRLKTYRYR